jgi:hypothetical protein
MAHRSMVRRSTATVVRSPLLMFSDVLRTVRSCGVGNRKPSASTRRFARWGSYMRARAAEMPARRAPDQNSLQSSSVARGTPSLWPSHATSSRTTSSATSYPPSAAGWSCHPPAARTATPTPTQAGRCLRCGAAAMTGVWSGGVIAAQRFTHRSRDRTTASATVARLCGKTSPRRHRLSSPLGAAAPLNREAAATLRGFLARLRDARPAAHCSPRGERRSRNPN